MIGLVFLNYWSLATASAGKTEDWNTFAHVAFLENYSFIDRSVPNLGYFFFPGLHILMQTIRLVSAADILTVRLALLPLLSLLVVLSFFLWSLSFTKDVIGVAASSSLFIFGNAILSRSQFAFPSNLGFVLLAMLLAFTLRIRRDSRGYFILSVLFLALTASHLPSAAAFLFSYFAVSVVNLLRSDRIRGRSTVLSQPVFWAITLGWAIYFSFPTVVDTVRQMKRAIGSDPLRYIFLMGRQNVGTGVPAWASWTQISLLFLAYILGGGLVGYWLLSRRPMPYKRTLLCGGLVGVTLMTGLDVLGGRSFEFDWLLYYGAFFTVPAVFHFLDSCESVGCVRLMRRLAVILLILLSLPAFLVNNGRIARDAVYANEVNATRFLNGFSAAKDGGSYVYFAGIGLAATPRTGMPRSIYADPPEPFSVMGWQDLSALMEELVSNFLHTQGGSAVLVNSARIRVFYQALLGISADHPMWRQMEHGLLRAQRIYNNGDVALYVP
jgi:hypothetical protein